MKLNAKKKLFIKIPILSKFSSSLFGHKCSNFNKKKLFIYWGCFFLLKNWPGPSEKETKVVKMFKILLCFSFIFPLIAGAISRSPAVEPFVEVKREPRELNKELGSVAGFNFKSAAIAKAQKRKIASQTQKALNSGADFSLTSLLVLMAFLSLPFASWQLMRNKVEQKHHEQKVVQLKIVSKYEENEELFESDKEKEDDDDDSDFKQAA